jgi:N-dimethylarginine dimethylaminohydrolase
MLTTPMDGPTWCSPPTRVWFEGQGLKTHEVTKGAFEGEGDALFAGGRLFCGYGFRSDREAHEEVAALLGANEIVPVKLVDPRFYHLDTCFCPLTASLALVYPGAFEPADLALLERSIERYSLFVTRWCWAPMLWCLRGVQRPTGS